MKDMWSYWYIDTNILVSAYITIWSYALISLFNKSVVFYQAKPLMFYNVINNLLNFR